MVLTREEVASAEEDSNEARRPDVLLEFRQIVQVVDIEEDLGRREQLVELPLDDGHLMSDGGPLMNDGGSRFGVGLGWD